jgi:hypothetical protein
MAKFVFKKRLISCRATCIHNGNKFYAWGYGRSKKSALKNVKRDYASAKAPYKYTNLIKEAA